MNAYDLGSFPGEKLAKAARDTFPNGCWIYDADYGMLRDIYSPIEFKPNLSELMRARLIDTAKRSIRIAQDYASNPGGNAVFYAHPIRTDGCSIHFAICTYLIRGRAPTMDSVIGRLANRVGRLVHEIETALAQRNSDNMTLTSVFRRQPESAD